ncbi:MAG: RES family NAD+ phosphorylase [Gammaproteobacteria bacterium]|nr:RES family NAD+ phosphorylase [Gammaproteobacteria bacterium]
MRLDPNVVAGLSVSYDFKSYLRVMPKQHKKTPLGMGFGKSRFSSPNDQFKLLYAAPDLETAIAEVIVRDRFEGKAKRMLDISEIEEFVVAEISTKKALTLLDLRKSGLLKLGVSTDAARAKAHLEGQLLSEDLHQQFLLDGILYASRLTGEDCIAVYDRAVTPKLKAGGAIGLAEAEHLIPALKSLHVSLRMDE